MEWLLHQIVDFNFLQLIFIVVFVITLTKSNTTKLIEKQTKEIHEEIEEVKDTIREVL